MALFATFISKLNNFNEIKKENKNLFFKLNKRFIYCAFVLYIYVYMYIYINRNMRIYTHMYDNNLKIIDFEKFKI